MKLSLFDIKQILHDKELESLTEKIVSSIILGLSLYVFFFTQSPVYLKALLYFLALNAFSKHVFKPIILRYQMLRFYHLLEKAHAEFPSRMEQYIQRYLEERGLSDSVDKLGPCDNSPRRFLGNLSNYHDVDRHTLYHLRHPIYRRLYDRFRTIDIYYSVCRQALDMKDEVIDISLPEDALSRSRQLLRSYRHLYPNLFEVYYYEEHNDHHKKQLRIEFVEMALHLSAIRNR